MRIEMLKGDKKSFINFVSDMKSTCFLFLVMGA
jgi:hypothetical protein